MLQPRLPEPEYSVSGQRALQFALIVCLECLRGAAQRQPRYSTVTDFARLRG